MTFSSREIKFQLASTTEDAELRRLLRENPMPGAISLSLEREPSYFATRALEGEPHQTVVAREPSGRPVGLFSRSERTAFVNGVPARVGYLGQLRLDAAYRGKLALVRAGFERCRELHRAGGVGFYATSIVEDNGPARRLLTASLPGLPTYCELGRMITFLLEVPRRARACSLARGTPDRLPEIAALLAESHARFQLAPAWTAEELASGDACPGLRPEDFLLVDRGGKLAGCAALWDQRAFKQTVIRAYAGWIGRARPLMNAAAAILGRPGLPGIGAQLSHAYLSHFAARGDDPAVAGALLDAGLADARRRGIDFLSLGLADGHPLARAARRRREREYPSRIYAVHWDDGAHAVEALDERPVHLEVATL